MVDANTRLMRESRKQDDFMCFELAKCSITRPFNHWFWKVVIL